MKFRNVLKGYIYAFVFKATVECLDYSKSNQTKDLILPNFIVVEVAYVVGLGNNKLRSPINNTRFRFLYSPYPSRLRQISDQV